MTKSLAKPVLCAALRAKVGLLKKDIVTKLVSNGEALVRGNRPGTQILTH
jgi:hypothetical protein